jgi:hypothetical protein
MPGRTWVIAPDADSLRGRWQALANAPAERKEVLFHPHLRKGQPGDKHSRKVVPNGLPGYPSRPLPVADDSGPILPPVRYGFRSFDRQWIIPDNRLINQPNPTLWEAHSERQVYLTARMAHSPTAGPAITFTGLIPDLHHYKGSFGGRIFPLWRDAGASSPNVVPKLLAHLAERYGRAVTAKDVVAYLAAVAAHPAYTARFKDDLVKPGLRIPLAADAALFEEAVELGRTIVWLHSFGERFADRAHGRPAGPPRLESSKAPRIPAAGAIPHEPARMPDTIDYDTASRRLRVGEGFIDNVDARVWSYEVSGKQVLRQWFSYRKSNRERPIIGDRRPPSPLQDVQPERWPAEYTAELIDVLHVLGHLVELEPAQADLLERIIMGPTISADELQAAGALDAPAASGHSRATRPSGQTDLLDAL